MSGISFIFHVEHKAFVPNAFLGAFVPAVSVVDDGVSDEAKEFGDQMDVDGLGAHMEMEPSGSSLSMLDFSGVDRTSTLTTDLPRGSMGGYRL